MCERDMAGIHSDLSLVYMCNMLHFVIKLFAYLV